MTNESVTVVIIAKNEASQILETIESARQIASSIIVIDDASVDETAILAIGAGAHVHATVEHGGNLEILWEHAFSRVSEGWILRMDADERITESLCSELLSVIKSEKYNGAYYARLNYFQGKPLHYGGWFRAQTLGLFRSNAWDRNWAKLLHSQVPVFGQIAVIPKEKAFMVHLDYANFKEFITRSICSYAVTEARQRYLAGVRSNNIKLIIFPLRKFFGRYVIRRGFRDGRHGFVAAFGLALYEFSIWVYIAEFSEIER